MAGLVSRSSMIFLNSTLRRGCAGIRAFGPASTGYCPRMTTVSFLRFSIQPARLFRQHDRNAVADRIGELGGARDQLLLLAVVFERALGERSDEDFEQLGIDAAGGAVRRNSHWRAPDDAPATIARLFRPQGVTAAWSRPRCSWQARFR